VNVKAFVIAMWILFAVAARAQTVLSAEASDIWFVQPSAVEYRTVDEWLAVHFKQHADFRAKRAIRGLSFKSDELFSVAIQLPDGRHTFSVDDAGKVVYANLTPEQALLFMTEFELAREDQAFEDLDKEQAARDLVPPRVLRNGTAAWTMQDLQNWLKLPGTVGDTNCSLKRVRVLSDQESTKDKRDTVLHELMHVASNCDQRLSTHRAIYEIAPTLLRLLRENPDLVKFLVGKDVQP
jgi:hypothetical protein